MTRTACGVLLATLLVAAPAAAQTVSFFSFTPPTISPTGPAQALFVAEISGQPTRVTLELGNGATPTVLELRDDGTNGDRVAGDKAYSVLVPTAPLLAAMVDSDVHRVFVGFLNLAAGTTTVFRGNIFVDVYTPEVGVYSVARISPDVQATTRLVNINDPASFPTVDLQRITREFYRWFGDDYDFLNVIYAPARFQNRTHFQVRNDVDGIGVAKTNNASRYSSAGRLQGISQFPVPTFFDGAETGHIHELGHQWINFLNFTPLASGIPHWPISSMAGGVMGFSIGGAGSEGGTFACIVSEQNGNVVLTRRVNAPVYNDLELYLMGLLPADRVATQIVFADQSAASSLQCSGQTFTGAVTRLSARDVISQYGARNPAAGDAPTRFRMATILVTRDGLASPETMALYSWLADRAEWRVPVPTHGGFVKEIGMPFHVATGERATLDMRVAIADSDFSLLPTIGSAAVNAGSRATFTLRVAPTGARFDDDVTFSCGTLPANVACSFSPNRIAPGTAGADVTLTVTTGDPPPSPRAAAGTYTILVEGSSSTGRHNTAISLTVR
jgi:hypothetical protein